MVDGVRSHPGEPRRHGARPPLALKALCALTLDEEDGVR
jgi:hypothetical protein